MEKLLKDEKEVALENLVIFKIMRSQGNKAKEHKYLSFCWVGKIRDQILIATKTIGSEKVPNEI
jgi:hypothetical protein